MRNAMWVGGGITGMGEIPMLGNPVKGLTALIKKIFYSGAEGFAYDPNDLTEEKVKWRRNLLLYTQSFTNNIYIKPDASLTVGGFAPDGTTTATKVIPNAVNTAYHGVYCLISDSMQAGKVYTASVYAKAAEYGVIRLSDTANSTFGMLFDLRNGTMSIDAAANRALNVTGAIEAVGNGWYRCSIQFTAIGQPPAVNATRVLNVGVFDAAIATYAGNGVSGLYIWGMQLEAGSLTPYQALTDFNSEFLQRFPLHALYQDAEGTVPVTAAGQPVGLMLDKSKGLSISTERLQSPIFEAAVWAGFDASISFVDGKMIRDGSKVSGSSTAYNRNKAGNQLIVGKSYRVEITVESMSGVAPYMRTSGVGGNIYFNKVGSNVSIVTMAVQSGFFFIHFLAGTSCVISNISIKELYGNHAYQTTSASRPILQQTPVLGNELVVNGNFSAGLTGWTNPDSGGAVTGASGGTVKLNANGGIARLRQSINVTSAGTYLVEVDAVAVTGGSIQFGIGNTTSGDLKYGVFSVAGKKRYSLVIQNVAVGLLGLALISNSTTAYAEFDNITVKKIEGYRTDQNYLEFDGSDDFLQTNNIDFTGTDEISIFSGLTKLRDNGSAILVELSTSTATNNSSFHVEAPSGSGSNNYGAASKGTVRQMAQAEANYAAPNSAVINTKSKISSDTLSLSVNGILAVTANNDQGAGKYGNYPLYIGRRGGTSLPFGGYVYGLIGVGKLASDSETIALEKELAKRVGVTLNV